MAESKKLTEEELIVMLQDLARELGRTPTRKDVPGWIKSICHSRFGKWCYALEAAGVKVPSEATLARRAHHKAKWKKHHNHRKHEGNRDNTVQGDDQEVL